LNFSYSSKVQELQQKLNAFMEEYIHPNESLYEQQLMNKRTAGVRFRRLWRSWSSKLKKLDYGICFCLKVRNRHKPIHYSGTA
jgi:acyl-CoA dehydrogenase